MRRCIIGFLLILGGMISTWAEEVPSQVTTSIATQGDVWVGQKVTLAIDLLAPGYFSGVPRFDFPQIPGVLLVPPEDHPVLGTKQINGQSYTMQHYEVLLFAKKPGPHEIPPFKIRFGIKRSPLDQDATPQEVLTPAASFTAKLPPGAENLPSLISANDLIVESKWSPLPHACKVGDAFTRTITYSATDVPGMAFPPFPVVKVEGFSVYPKTPIISDQSERGELRGSRIDAITYVCKQAGHFVVPAAQLTWWNISDQTLQTIRFPEQSFEVAANSALEPQLSQKEMSPIRYVEWIGIILGAAIILMILCRYIPWSACSRALRFLRPVHLKPLNPSS